MHNKKKYKVLCVTYYNFVVIAIKGQLKEHFVLKNIRQVQGVYF